MEQVLVGQDKRKNGAASIARPTADPGGMVLWRFVDGRVWMDVHDDGVVWRRGGVDGGPGKVDGSVSALEMDRWKMAAAVFESASVRYGPSLGVWMGWGIQV